MFVSGTSKYIDLYSKDFTAFANFYTPNSLFDKTALKSRIFESRRIAAIKAPLSIPAI